MCNLKEKLPGTSSPVQFCVGMPGGAENIVHGIRNLLSDIQTGYWSPWTLPMHSTLSAELHSSSKYRTSSLSSSHGCGSAMDNSTYICSSYVQTQFPSACGVRQSDSIGPFLFCLAIQPFLEEEASTQVQSLTYIWMTSIL